MPYSKSTQRDYGDNPLKKKGKKTNPFKFGGMWLKQFGGLRSGTNPMSERTVPRMGLSGLFRKNKR